MFLTWLMLAVALALSAVAAFYSIIGLTAIFAAAVVPIIIMGTILEIAKLTVTVWLHEYWNQVKITMKLYLVPAVFILMVITSMGIFGFLSKAHLDQTVPTGDVAAQVSLIDERINNERETIANARNLLGQLDKAVTDISNSPDREIRQRDGSVRIQPAAERALEVRRSQARDRTALTRTIEESQGRIVKLQEEKAPIASQLRAVEAEVGPVKYIAALIYGDNPEANLLERAVRYVIILLVVVFDPLAIMMLLAFTESYQWEKARRRRSVVAVTTDHLPQQTQKIKEPDNDTMDDAREYHAQDLDERYPRHDLDNKSMASVVEPVEIITDSAIDDELDNDDDDGSEIKEAKRRWKIDHPNSTLKEQRHLLRIGAIDHLPWLDYISDNDIPFGPTFPTSSAKGDMFLRSDVIPTRLYKYNGDKWIEVDKTLADRYVYNQAYIDHLIQKIVSGEYDIELLNDSERAQMEQRLKQDAI
jgi:hypothetical protein